VYADSAAQATESAYKSWRPGPLADISEIYLQFLDLTDLAQLERIAAEVLPQL
jgi:hypothetical protein